MQSGHRVPGSYPCEHRLTDAISLVLTCISIRPVIWPLVCRLMEVFSRPQGGTLLEPAAGIIPRYNFGMTLG